MGHSISFSLGGPGDLPVERLYVHCAKPKCGKDCEIGLTPMPFDTLIAALKAWRCPSCGGRKAFMNRKPRPTPVGEYEQWLRNHDTGDSSITIWCVMRNHPFPVLTGRRPDVPHDASDFGRCYRLLKVMPEWRDRLPEVAAAYPAWTPIVAAWDELTKLFEAEDWDGFAACMKRIVADRQDPTA